MSRPFTVTRPLRFAHCDPAGIAYYPRYFELCDGVIEDWTAAVIGVPRRAFHLDHGLALPTVTMNTVFTAPSRLGDMLDFRLTVGRIGTSSIALTIAVDCGGEPRFATDYVQVLTDIATMRPVPWPAEWRARIEETTR